jgi:hypothetical protein
MDEHAELISYTCKSKNGPEGPTGYATVNIKIPACEETVSHAEPFG